MTLKTKKTLCIILSIILLVSLSVIAVVYHNNAIEDAYEEGRNSGYSKGHTKGYNKGYDVGYDEGYAYYEAIKNEYNFFHKYAVTVTETGKRYHRYNCYHIKNRGFYIYNIENAEAKGYTPCLDCYD